MTTTDLINEHGCIETRQMSNDRAPRIPAPATEAKAPEYETSVTLHVRRDEEVLYDTRSLSLHQLLVENPKLLLLALKKSGVHVAFHWASPCETVTEVLGARLAARYLAFIAPTRDTPYTQFGHRICHEVMDWNMDFVRREITIKKRNLAHPDAAAPPTEYRQAIPEYLADGLESGWDTRKNLRRPRM